MTPKEAIYDTRERVLRMQEQLDHHLNKTCIRHEGEMRGIKTDLSNLRDHDLANLRDHKNLVLGVAVVLPLLLSILGWVYVSHLDAGRQADFKPVPVAK
jgi:hypothetical protein